MADKERVALITGVTGQDGSYLAEFLLSKGYRVWGLQRRSSSFNTARIDGLIADPKAKFDMWRADLTDQSSLIQILHETKPDEIYNLGAQTHVKVSFEIPTYTFDTDATGTLRLLEAVRALGLGSKIYQASSSEMFGSSPPPQNESTPFSPRSPYAVAKVAAYHLCVNYRDAYGIWIANGILFNHESPRRGETFVTRKISRAVARIALGVQRYVVLGNIDAKRDWGYAPEYVQVMWRMLQRKDPDDYVVATGEAHTVREFAERAFGEVGIALKWEGDGHETKGIVESTSGSEFNGHMKVGRGDRVIVTSKEYFRPTEADYLMGDSSKARAKLGWRPKVGFDELVKLMVRADVRGTFLLLEGTRKHKEEWREFLG
ncbi:MAG: GDP-mannose 4,6-dehydratase [Nitrososphaerota archaeon]|nr:GDP-mannose 4,6-dehydratase [Nitrososphaerota archaeon]